MNTAIMKRPTEKGKDAGFLSLRAAMRGEDWGI